MDPNDELLREQQRERARQQQLAPSPDVRLDRPAERESTTRLPERESPCFTIEHLTLKGDESARFAWALAHAEQEGDSPIGRCLGSGGVNLVMKRLQNAIVGQGYVTTRILPETQELTTGTLQLTVVPGRIRETRDSSTWPL